MMMKMKKMNSNTSSCVIFKGDEYMVIEILSGLPVKSLLRFKCVSKRWCSLIQDPDFVDLHSARSITRPGATFFISRDLSRSRNITFFGSTLYDGPHFHIIDYASFISDAGGHDRFGPYYYQPPECFTGRDKLRCTQILNGLLLMGFKEETVWIMNPSTRKTILLTKTNIKEEEAINNKDDDQYYNWMNKEVLVRPKYAFGLDPVTKKYKVICICEVEIWYVHPEMFLYPVSSEEHDEHEEFFPEQLLDPYYVYMVLTIEDDVNDCYWRRIDEIPPYNIHNSSDPPIYLNGALYWRKLNSCDDYEDTIVEVIVVFDVSSEKFSVIRIPDFVLKPALHRFMYYFGEQLQLYEVDGCLAILENVNTTGPNTIEIWKLVVTPPEAAAAAKSAAASCSWVKETILTLSFDWRKEGYLFEVIGRTNQILLKSYNSKNGGSISICYYDRDEDGAAENKTMKKEKKKKETSCEMLQFTGECASFTGIQPFCVNYTHSRKFQTCTETLWSL